MKGLNTKWKVIALGTFAVMVTIWSGSRMEAKTGQEYTAQSARVRPQILYAAINALGPIGLTRGQTLRIGVLFTGPGGGPHVVLGVTVFDCGGNTLMSNTYDPDTSNTCSSFDLNADQLPQAEFDNSGRVEVGVRLNGGDGNKVGSFFGTVQVFDHNTGHTTEMLTLAAGDGNG